MKKTYNYQMVPFKTVVESFLTHETLIDFLEIGINQSVLIIDQKVYDLYPKLKQFKSKSLLLKSHEENKDWKTIEKIIDFLDENKVHRGMSIIGMGGGIITDIVGFAASIYKRGTRLTLIPTTLLAMVDASIGGKTAINTTQGKNHIGSFYPASRMYICPEFLETLEPLDYYCGLVESIKTCIIFKDLLLNNLSADMRLNLDNIFRIIDLKMSLCNNDLQDHGERKKLNLGHSFAHLTEKISRYWVTHGEAVSLGLMQALLYSYQEKMISSSNFERLNQYFRQLLQYNPRYKEFKELLQSKDYQGKLSNEWETYLSQDKKNTDQLNLVLFDREANVEIRATDKKDILEQCIKFIDI